jgi:hypothetical protein
MTMIILKSLWTDVCIDSTAEGQHSSFAFDRSRFQILILRTAVRTEVLLGLLQSLQATNRVISTSLESPIHYSYVMRRHITWEVVTASLNKRGVKE